MSSNYDSLTAEEYNTIYYRFLKWPPEELLNHADMKEGDTIVDLCCGANARLTVAALNMGASEVLSVDKTKHVNDIMRKVIPQEHKSKVAHHCMSATKFLMASAPIDRDYFDIVACRQGINYFFNDMTAMEWKALVTILKGDGKFVFNTFRKCPPERPVVKEYFNKGKKFTEVYWSVDRMVHHVQIMEGHAPHVTTFDHISKKEYDAVLSNYFSYINIESREHTDIYVCSNHLTL